MARNIMEENRRYIEHMAWEWKHGDFAGPDPTMYGVQRIGPVCWILHEYGSVSRGTECRMIGRVDRHFDGFGVHFMSGPGAIDMIDYFESWERIPRQLELLAYLDLDYQWQRQRLCRLIRRIAAP